MTTLLIQAKPGAHAQHSNRYIRNDSVRWGRGRTIDSRNIVMFGEKIQTFLSNLAGFFL